MAALLYSGAAAAQGAPAAAAAPTDQLQEVVVTATRQASTVNRVAMSLTAVTQSSLDQQGIQDLPDLVGTVPGLSINQSLGPGLANIAIRGIQQGAQGEATTGFYLDDIPLQKPNAGGIGTQNGTPLPPLFDLERVEILRGPQGTLYGSSSEGGTIRYITPTPSLTTYSVYAKGSVSSIRYGGTSYEGGVAVGGPIVQDKLGFRASAYIDRRAGWIDLMQFDTARIFAKNANNDNVDELRGALLWQITDNFRATLGYFNSYEKTDENSTAMDYATAYPVVIPTACYNTTGITDSKPSSNPKPVGMGDAACASLTAAGKANFTRPGETFGPYPLSRYQALAVDYSPADTRTSIPSLTLEYDFPSFTAKFVSSYVFDHETSVGAESQAPIRQMSQNATEGPITSPNGWQELHFTRNGTYFDMGSHVVAANKRKAWTEELRFNSNEGPDAQRKGSFSWVAGLYYYKAWEKQGYLNTYGDLDGLNMYSFGITTTQRYGVPTAPLHYYDLFGSDEHQYGSGYWSVQLQKFYDFNFSGYGQAYYWLTDQLQISLGLRKSQTTTSFTASHYGPTTGTPASSPATAGGTATQYPLTPAFGARFQLTNNKMVYVSAAKGFRPGGANPVLGGVCDLAVAHYGITLKDLPNSYGPDSVWSYEAGAKLGFGNRIQVNGDVYRINWSNIQTTQSPGFSCGDNFTVNAGTAYSQGFELESQAILFPGFSTNASLTYDDAKYTQDAIAIHGPLADLVVAAKGQKFALPAWTVSIGARYDFNAGPYNPYVRVDAHYTSGYDIAVYPEGNWSPDTNHVPSGTNVNLRTGVAFNGYDLNFFVTNAFNSTAGPKIGGRSGCTSEACTTYGSYPLFRGVNAPQPRTIGVQLVFKH
jgi:outer membrane receptor protein involved in Fe transport